MGQQLRAADQAALKRMIRNRKNPDSDELGAGDIDKRTTPQKGAGNKATWSEEQLNQIFRFKQYQTNHPGNSEINNYLNTYIPVMSQDELNQVVASADASSYRLGQYTKYALENDVEDWYEEHSGKEAHSSWQHVKNWTADKYARGRGFQQLFWLTGYNIATGAAGNRSPEDNAAAAINRGENDNLAENGFVGLLANDVGKAKDILEDAASLWFWKMLDWPWYVQGVMLLGGLGLTALGLSEGFEISTFVGLGLMALGSLSLYASYYVKSKTIVESTEGGDKSKEPKKTKRGTNVLAQTNDPTKHPPSRFK